MPKEVTMPKGTRDLMPDEMALRQEIIGRIRKVFESYGFLPLETPAIESWEVLSAKGAGGPEILDETYNFEDKGGRRIGLRYDLTVPLARVIAMNPNLPLPFKRYQIDRVWRYGDIAKGRSREFWQADIDIVGAGGMLADAEIIACTIDAFISLGFEKFLVRLNNKKVLSALVRAVEIDERKVTEVLRVIDKLDKVGVDGVREELAGKIPREKAERILELIGSKGEPGEILEKVEKIVENFEEGVNGVKELRELISFLKEMKVAEKIRIDLSLARGLDYYTGPIFEVFVSKEIGSLAGGGRYDGMVGLFLGRDIPATGISLGIERIAEIMKKEVAVGSGVFVANVNEEVVKECLKIARKFREAGIPASFDLRGRNLAKQLEYANSLKIPFVIVVGPKEIKGGKFRVRNFKTGEEVSLNIEEAVNFLKNIQK